MFSLRRLAVLLLVVGAALFAAVPAASAQAPCPCRQLNVPETIETAQDVFLGTITDAARVPGDARAVTFDYTVSVERVYRGSITTEQVNVATTTGFLGCSAARPTVGRPYLFSLVSVDDDNLVAAQCNDVMLASATVVRRVERLLGDGRTPVPAEPATVVLQSAGASEPDTVTRAAAPGAALVLVGLLGLVVVRRVGRPRG